MATNKVSINTEWAKIATALFSAGMFIFYAGQLNQKVADMQQRLEKIENRLEVYHMQPAKPIGGTTLITGGTQMEACLLNDEERNERKLF